MLQKYKSTQAIKMWPFNMVVIKQSISFTNEKGKAKGDRLYYSPLFELLTASIVRTGLTAANFLPDQEGGRYSVEGLDKCIHPMQYCS